MSYVVCILYYHVAAKLFSSGFLVLFDWLVTMNTAAKTALFVWSYNVFTECKYCDLCEQNVKT